MAYKFRIPRYESPDIEPLSVSFDVIEEKEEIGLINGQMARSAEEWRVSFALDVLKRNYIYQYAIGPLGQRGSYSLDFLVEDVPNWVPLEVQSERWHTGRFAQDEKLRQLIIERIIGARMRFVWEDQLQNKEDAVRTVKMALQNPTVERI